MKVFNAILSQNDFGLWISDFEVIFYFFWRFWLMKR